MESCTSLRFFSFQVSLVGGKKKAKNYKGNCYMCNYYGCKNYDLKLFGYDLTIKLLLVVGERKIKHYFDVIL